MTENSLNVYDFGLCMWVNGMKGSSITWFSLHLISLDHFILYWKHLISFSLLFPGQSTMNSNRQ